MDQQLLDALYIWLTPVFYFGGLLAAIVWPYLNAKSKSPGIQFDWEYVKWQVIISLVGFIPTLLVNLNVAQIETWAGQGLMGWLLAFGAGFGFARGGREVQKTKSPK